MTPITDPGFDLMRLASLDSETHRFRNGLRAPPVVCASSSRFKAGAVGREKVGELLLGPKALVAKLRELADGGYYIAFANAAYDLCVAAQADPTLFPLIFKLLEEGRIVDVLITEALHAIYGGHLGKTSNGDELRKPSTGEVTNRYSLDLVLHLVCKRVDAKLNDVLRESYALVEGIDSKRWPLQARQYPVDDSDNTLDVAADQITGVYGSHAWVDLPPLPGQVSGSATICRHCNEELNFSNTEFCLRAPRSPRQNLYNMSAQVEADFALQLGNAHSLRTDPERITKLSAEVEEKHRIAVERFQKKGWVRTGQHLWRTHGNQFRCNRCGTLSADASESRCVADKADGTEDQSAVKHAIAVAYGAKMPCLRCKGTGKVDKIEEVECRGVKVGGRYKGCLGPHCLVCVGLRVLQKNTGEKACKNVFEKETGKLLEEGCDGTGFNLDAVPLLPRTETYGVKTDRDVKMESGDEDMSDYGEDEAEKTRTTYIPFLLEGVHAPLDLRPNVLVASGRCSYGTIHQFPREGGPRGCIRARGGWCGYPIEMVLGSTDYAAGELCTLSSYCYYLFRYSEMMQAINRAGDPGILHSDLASEVLGISLEEFLVRLKAGDKQAVSFRQAMKPINFGVPGGMGVPKLVYTNRKKNVGFTVCERGPARNRKGEPGYWGARFCVLTGGATQCGVEKITEWKGYACTPVCKACCMVVEQMLKPAYFRRYPEVKDYHKWAGKWIEQGKPMPCLLWDAEVQKARIVRERGGCDFPAFANNGFQAMLADIGKHAFVAATKECYLGVKADGSPSPLGGCRLPVYLHDEPLSELPLDIAHLAGPRIAEIMMESGRLLAPFVTWKAETALAFWWDKAMQSVYEEHVDELAVRRQKLVPWGEVPEEHQHRYERTRGQKAA